MMSNEIQNFVKSSLSVVSDQNIEQKVLTDGRSGADVYSLKVQSKRKRLSGCYIVKVCPSASKQTESEADKARRFYDYSPRFSEHLVKVEAKQHINGKDVIIYNHANESRLNSVAFSDLDGEHLARYTECVSRELLSVLNEDTQIGGTVEDFFQSLLAKQLGEGGRFTERMEMLLERPDAECIVLNGAVYPNPFHLIKNMDCWSNCLSDIHLFQGAVHGDLHGHNLLATEQNYSIIDFDSSSVNSYLLFDHAYFEFSIFYDNSKDNDLKPWDAMLKQLITPSVFEQAELREHYLECKVRNAVCAGIAQWAKEMDLNKQRDDIEVQFLLARIAAGINFFCKKTCASQERQRKVLFFICYCFKLLLEKIKYSIDENDVSTLSISSAFTDVQNLWEDAFKFTNYIPILVTDDRYTPENFNQLKSLCCVQWAMVVDVGLEEHESVVYKSLLETVNTKPVKRIDIFSGKSAESINHTLNVLSIRKPVNIEYASLWRTCGKQVLNHLSRLLSSNPQVPLVLVFDCSRDALPFRNQLIDRLCDLSLPIASRFVALRASFSKDFSLEMDTLETENRWRFVQHPGASLLHAAQSCSLYLQELSETEVSANLPSINGISVFSKEDLLNFSSSIELVYAGCERFYDSRARQVGFDMSGGGDSLGEIFYKGGEATWNDIANHRDLRLLEDKRYRELITRLMKMVDETSPRIRKVRLIHGAGTGGTTLSKRILWDLKEYVPCIRLKKYVAGTANMLLEIYKRTGKRVFTTVEQGSTVITDEDLNSLIQQINAENGKLLLLMITRSNESVAHTARDEQKENNDIIVQLTDTMPVSIAVNFKDTFSNYAIQRNSGSERIRLLEAITGDRHMKDQRTPFFYGFYAFQDEYNLLERLKSTVSVCTPRQQVLLNSLALVTVFSQNICVAFSELTTILAIEDSNFDAINIHIMMENLPVAISKLMVTRENGFRMCHRIIAEKVLLLLHDSDEQYTETRYVFYPAIKDYIQTLYEIYGERTERVDGILKELIIDRAYIDSDAQKTKFSPLVEAIPNWTEKETLFHCLIEKFPENPHYYNHLARLLAFGDEKTHILPQYNEAVEQAKQAVIASEQSGYSVSIHRTTLGCIYGQWIIHDIKEESKNKRAGHLTRNYDTLIRDIDIRYNLACEEFECARREIEIHDSFSYFPQIHMECEIIYQLINFDHGRSLSQLVEQEPAFKAWYDEHFSIAAELTAQMSERVDTSDPLIKGARQRLDTVANADGKIKKHLTNLLNSNIDSDKQRRRALVYGTFVTSGCKWSKLDREICELAEQSFRKNFIESDGTHRNSDIETWFELYRRCTYFNAAEAQHILADYMEDGYKKEYLMFLLTFVLWEKGIGGASPSAVNQCIKEAHQMARQHGINTTREYDCFVGAGTTNCPIVSVADVIRDKEGNPTGLKTFTGRVIDVEQTHGKILLDKLNLEVTFIPNPTTVNREEQRIFTRKDINCPVKLNLMFSYSGLRGWNVLKLYQS